MKHALRISLVALIFCAVFFRHSNNANALQSNSKNYFDVSHLDELVIEIPKINSKNQNDIQNALSAVPGVFYIDYCDAKKIMMFEVDRSVQANNSFLDNVLMPMGIDYNIKIGVTIKQISYDCSHSTEPNLSH